MSPHLRIAVTFIILVLTAQVTYLGAAYHLDGYGLNPSVSGPILAVFWIWAFKLIGYPTYDDEE